MDNFYQGCPPKMSDGRHMTDYRPNTVMEEQIKYTNGIIRDDEARLFLQGNAEKFIDGEWKYLRDNRSCWKNECVHVYPTRMFPPWFNEEIHNYNTMSSPNHVPFPCTSFGDYRMTVTNSQMSVKNDTKK
jgi:hypothetical protein